MKIMKLGKDAPIPRRIKNYGNTPLGPCTGTARNFEIITFEDRYGTPCSLQQSSIFDDQSANQPGATAVWLGVDRQTGTHDGMCDSANATRMHIDRKQAQALICVLEQWLITGNFCERPVVVPRRKAK